MDRRAIDWVVVPASSRRRRGASTPANSVPTAQHFSPASCRRRSGCSAPRFTLGSATATASTTATAARKSLAHFLYRANAWRCGGNWQKLHQDKRWLVASFGKYLRVRLRHQTITLLDILTDCGSMLWLAQRRAAIAV